MSTAIVMAILFGLGGITADMRHETPGPYVRSIELHAKKRERNIKIDKTICYLIAFGFIALAFYFMVS